MYLNLRIKKMKNVLLLITLSITVFFFIQGNETIKNNVDTEQLLMKMEKEWANASISKDIYVFERILDPNFVYHQENGKLLNKQNIIKSISEDTNEYKSVIVDDMKVQMFGTDIAVVTGGAKWIGFDINKKKFNSNERWTNVWVKTNEKWLCIVGHGNFIKDK